VPRYYFHIADGRVIHDNEGTELPDLKSARAEAIRTSGTILSEQNSSWTGTAWRMSVADEQGTVLLTIDFSALDHQVADAKA
jgi:hypothetical protein